MTTHESSTTAYYPTTVVNLPERLRNGNHFCAHCGSVTIDKAQYYNHGHDKDVTHFCTCEQAKQADELKSEIDVLSHRLSLAREQLARMVQQSNIRYVTKRIEFEYEYIRKQNSHKHNSYVLDYLHNLKSLKNFDFSVFNHKD